MPTINDIRALMTEANEAGDHLMARICRDALDGDCVALDEVACVISDACAQIDADDDCAWVQW